VGGVPFGGKKEMLAGRNRCFCRIRDCMLGYSGGHLEVAKGERRWKNVIRIRVGVPGGVVK